MSDTYRWGMREKGVTVPISIGTALAAESALGVYPDKPVVDPPPVAKYKEIFLNLATLARNAVGSLPKEEQSGILPGELLTVMKEDVDIFTQAIHDRYPDVRVHAYWCDYSILKRKFPHATLKTPQTPSQKTAYDLELATYQLVVQHAKELGYELFNLDIGGATAPSFIVTHYPVDLLSRYYFRKLALLETHSGGIKLPSQWSRKLGLSEEDASVIPFNKFTLQVFGDKAKQFLAQPLPLRRTILRVAREDHWTAVSTMDRIRASFDKQKDPYLTVLTKPFL